MNEYIQPIIAAELMSETEIFIENNKIEEEEVKACASIVFKNILKFMRLE